MIWSSWEKKKTVFFVKFVLSDGIFLLSVFFLNISALNKYTFASYQKHYFIQSINQSISVNQNNIFSNIPHTIRLSWTFWRSPTSLDPLKHLPPRIYEYDIALSLYLKKTGFLITLVFSIFSFQTWDVAISETGWLVL